MKRPGFWRCVVVAAGLAVAAALFLTTFLSIFGVVASARSLIPALSLAYLIFLLRSSTVRVGRLTTLGLWAIVSVTAWFFVASFGFYLSIHVLMLWLVRSLYFHRGVLAPLTDAGLCVFATVAALGVLHRTGSPLLSVWVFFLCQAAFVAIPQWTSAKPRVESETTNDAFAEANRRAEAALNQLLTR